MFFEQLKISQWQQFEDVSVRFHNRLTVLTGPNGSGKTTLLNLLARHGDQPWQYHPIGTPRAERSGVIRWFARFFGGIDKSSDVTIGQMTYSNGVTAAVTIEPQPGNAQQPFNIPNQQPVKTIYLPSHRPVFRYQPVSQIPAAKKDKSAAFNEVLSSSRSQYMGGGGSPHSWYMKSTLLGWAIQGYGVRSSDDRSIMSPDSEQVRLYEGFQDVLRQILPKSLGFQRFEIRNFEIVFVCNDGRDEFLLETSSGGVSALIDLAWHVYMYWSKENTNFTVLIDEAENHLHPSMQRVVLRDFLAAFPGVRFVVSTHSPLIVGSVKDSYVYVLRHNKEGKIVSQYLDLQQKAKSATDILDDVLGVSASMPIWAEEELARLVREFAQRPVDRDSFERLRKDLAAAGLDGLVPEAITQVLRDKSDKTS